MPAMVPDYTRQQTITPGCFYMALMPSSECAMHMGIAGTVQQVYATGNGVRLSTADGPHMTDGEAGIYSNGQRRYAYGMKFPD